MLIIVRLGSHPRKAWSTECCAQTGLQGYFMIKLLCCRALFCISPCLHLPSYCLIACMHVHKHVAPLEKTRDRDREECVCASKKGGSMHFNTIPDINKHTRGTQFQITFSKIDFKNNNLKKKTFARFNFRISKSEA